MSDSGDVASAKGPAFRAFLSHSSADKDFVLTVARQLGRRRVRLDVWEFESGIAFVKAIRVAVAGSDMFVLFASRQSLRSFWVKFEIEEAEELLRIEALKNALVLIIDRDTRPSDLPKWMQRGLIDRVLNPNAARRIIEHQLNRLRGLEYQPLFLGRGDLLKDFSEQLIPAPEAAAPHLLIVGGLPGIGRRTFLAHACEDFLSVRIGPVLYLRATDGLDALHLALLDELGAMDTKAQVAEALKQFQASTLEGKASTIAQMLASASLGNVAPIIVDEGALFDSSGRYTADALAVFEALRKYPESIICITHTRRPIIEDRDLRNLHAVYTRVPPLELAATKLLLNQSLRNAGVAANTDQVNELAPYLEGYPPAINLAVSVAKEYGLAALLADKSGLVDFQIRTFAGVLDKLKISEDEWELLRVLTSEVVLPLQALAAVLGKPENETATLLRRLVDLNLVLPSGENYQIAFPVKFAVSSLRGLLTEKEFGRIATHLKNTYWDNQEQLPPIEVIYATVHSAMRSDGTDLTDFTGFVIPSMLYRAAKEYYERGGPDAWERARKLVSQLLLLDAKHKSGLILLFKIDVRLGQWAEAERTLTAIRQRGFPEQHFLTGFLLWKKRGFAKAVSAFRTALALGQTSVEVYHGLGICLFRLDDLDGAGKVVQEGLSRRRPNSLLLDLAAQIAIARRNYAEAESYIDRLHRVRADADYHHRLATLLNARKRFRDALPHAKAAMEGARRRFEVEATLVDTLIELGDFQEASTRLEDLDRRGRYGTEHKDVRLGLRCKSCLRQGKWKEAEDLWEELGDRARPVHAGLRQEILQQKVEDLSTTPGQRAEAASELEELRASLGSDQISLFTTAEPDEESASSEDDLPHGT
jgi:tetratricopeptide (TPR) repeat protein